MITPTEWTRFKFEWLEQVMYAADLTLAARVTGFCIIQHCNMGSESGWPSLSRITKLTGLSKPTVLAAITQLEANGHLNIDYGSPGRGHSNIYTPILKGKAIEPIEGGEKVKPLNLSSNATETEKVKFLNGKGKIDDRKGKIAEQKGKAILPEHLKNTFNNTLENTVRSATEPADEEIREARKQAEEELSGWRAEGLINDRELHAIRTTVGEMLDGVAAGEATRAEVSDAYAKIRAAVLRRHPKQQPPSGGSAACSPEGSQSDGLSSPPINPGATLVPPSNERPPQSSGSPEPTVPMPPEPSRRKRKLSAEEQQNRDIRKSAVWRDHANGLIDDGEAQRRIDEIDAAPPEACGAA